jgi:hypothetical protein
VSPFRYLCTLTGHNVARPVTVKGLMLGREADCDVVSQDPSASRRHALLRLTSAGVELVPLGRADTEVNGTAITKPTMLADGDRIAVPGITAVVAITSQAATIKGPTRTLLRSANGESFGISYSPFVLGGASDDDLIVQGWPEHAITLHVANHEPHIEALTPDVTINGEPAGLDDIVAVGDGDVLALAGQAFTVVQARAAATTAAGTQHPVPRRIRVEMLPRGGRVFFTMGDAEHVVYLADRRLDLLVTLLQPPTGRGGDYVPDDVVRARVWPRSPGVSRQEINTLISRCRRDLLDVGLPGARLIERAPGGGGTRIVVMPNAEITVL